MSEKAKQFLVELSKDPVKMEDFWKDPDAFLVSADLTAEEKDVLGSGDSERIQELVGPLTGLWVDQCPHPRKPEHGDGNPPDHRREE
jgi:hypothetical protein